ncbi:unnamed protein product [Cuscuta epithymum]|uniref:Uncharacterized protein n=1 Tax=Cuscuta epithymum TaxID=186058 RepID=A0AAV0CDQ9_9ASTE|nr:unnamed protein product [Cuscuta epithymum]
MAAAFDHRGQETAALVSFSPLPPQSPGDPLVLTVDYTYCYSILLSYLSIDSVQVAHLRVILMADISASRTKLAEKGKPIAKIKPIGAILVPQYCTSHLLQTCNLVTCEENNGVESHPRLIWCSISRYAKE